MGVLVVFGLAGCRGRSGTPAASTPPSRGGAFVAKKPAPAESGPKTPAAELAAELTKIINEYEIKYIQLNYDWNEDLLEKIDRVEAYLGGRSKSEPPRYMAKLEAKEELDHLRETIRRWEAKTGRKLRPEIDALKADVAARKPGELFHPEFQKKFSLTFDDFIPIEVQEIRERRNRRIHQAAQPLFEKYRATSPDAVKQYEAMVNAPPYNLTPQQPSEPATKTPSPPKS